MFKLFLKNLSKVFLAGLLLACFWLLVHRSSHRSSGPATLKGLTLSVWLPVQESVAWVLAFPETTLNAVRELKNSKQEVSRLKVENQTLHLELSNQKSLESELSRLQTILQIKSKLPHKAKIARIIAHDPSTWNKSFIIDIGTEDGVTSGAAVISEQGGIVGQVLQVNAKNSRVLLITDTDSSVSGLDRRSGVTGIIQGTGRNPLRLGYVDANEDVQKDDVIVSSGLGGIFPKGYALGSVTKKGISENGLSAEIEVAPAVDFAALDYVFVLPSINVFE
jgi:rod shape-determining protein MreC